MATEQPWTKLAFLSKIEIKSTKGELVGVLVEDSSVIEYDAWDNYSPARGNYRNSETTIRVDGWNANTVMLYHTDYPDEFKKLVQWFGDWNEAWAVWTMLKEDDPLPDDFPWHKVADQKLYDTEA
jgi:hypothetical protein